MERRWLTGFMASLAFVQGVGVAHAQEIVVDLPDPFGVGDATTLPQQPPAPKPPVVAPTQPAPVQAQYTGIARATEISRKSGGTVITVTLQQALPLLRLELNVLTSQVKIHEGTLITTSGQRIAIREFRDTQVLAAQSTLVSENLNLRDAVASVEIRAESYKAESDVEIKAISDSGVPKLSVKMPVVQPPAPPVTAPQPPPPPPVVNPRPQPYRPPEPPRTGPGCYDGLCIGDTGYNVSRDSRQVQVVSIENGTFTLRFADNGGVGGGWSRSDIALMRGCSQDVCVGDRAYNVSRGARVVQVAGINTNGKLVLRFEDNGGVGAGWDRSDLALMKGCVKDVCVGTRAFNVSRDNRRVVIVGVSVDQKLVLRFEDNGGVGAGWDRADLALAQGCYGGFCVGDTAYNIERDSRVVTIIAIDVNGKFILSFNDNGGVGAGWDRPALAKVKGCGNTYCVGNNVIVLQRQNRVATVVGIQDDGGYVLRFLDNGGIGAGWQDRDVARAR